MLHEASKVACRQASAITSSPLHYGHQSLDVSKLDLCLLRQQLSKGTENLLFTLNKMYTEQLPFSSYNAGAPRNTFRSPFHRQIDLDFNTMTQPCSEEMEGDRGCFNKT